MNVLQPGFFLDFFHLPVDSGAQLSLAAFKKVDTVVVDVEADEIAVEYALKDDVDPW